MSDRRCPHCQQFFRPGQDKRASGILAVSGRGQVGHGTEPSTGVPPVNACAPVTHFPLSAIGGSRPRMNAADLQGLPGSQRNVARC